MSQSRVCHSILLRVFNLLKAADLAKYDCVKKVRIRSYSGSYLSAFSPNVGKCEPE